MTLIDNDNFEQFIASDKKVLIDFFATWCGPCKSMLPILEQADSEEPNRIGKIDVDKFPEIASKFGIRSIPTLITFQNGKVVDKHVGAVYNSSELIAML